MIVLKNIMILWTLVKYKIMMGKSFIAWLRHLREFHYSDCNHIVYKHISSKFSALILILSAIRTCTQIDNFYYFTTRGHSSFEREFKNEGEVVTAQLGGVFLPSFSS